MAINIAIGLQRVTLVCLAQCVPTNLSILPRTMSVVALAKQSSES